MEPTWTIRRRLLSAKLPPITRLVGIAILEHRNNKDGRCFPAHVTLADICQISVAGVKRAIAQLKLDGLISSKRTQKACLYSFPSQLIDSSSLIQGELSDSSTRVSYPNQFKHGVGEDQGEYE